jgi:hypothetical protein
MFQAFAPYECERWTYLLGQKSGKWAKITPIKVWSVPSAFDSSPDIPLIDMLSLPVLAPHADREAIILRCGHSRNAGTAVATPRQVLDCGRWSHELLFEGFVSVVPGKLAIGFNHEGGVCVFSA